MKIHLLRIPRPRVLVSAIAALTLLGTLQTSQAALFKDSQLEALQDAGKYAELEKLAQARLKIDGSEAEARAALFRKYGATVEVEQSEPVQWPTQPATV